MKNSDLKILIVDDESSICEVLSAALKDEDFHVEMASHGAQALKTIEDFQPHIVFLDVWMPGDLDGIDVLKKIKFKTRSPQVIMMSGHGTIETAVNAVKIGAYDFMEKPISIDRVTILVKNIMDLLRERQGKENLLSHIQASIRLIGVTEESRRMKKIVSKVAHMEDWSFIQGERGTGKTTVAKNIHFLSSRAGASFVNFKCSNVPKDLLYGEIFGYEAESLPGLEKPKKGLLQIAHKGTLYLDEAEFLTSEVQQGLVHLLKTGEAKSLEGKIPYLVDVKVIIGSHRNLDSLVKEGSFREDLFRRITVLPVHIQPLNRRQEDIPILFDHFADEICRKTGGERKHLRKEALEILKNYSWPGNISELRNFVERLYILMDGIHEIGVEDLNYAGMTLSGQMKTIFSNYGNFREARARFEKDFLLAKIEENNGNISRTSEAIGLERSYLHRKIKAYGLDGYK